MKYRFTLLFLLIGSLLYAQNNNVYKKVMYKETPQRKLYINVYTPEKQAKSKAAVVLIHGGGWNSGKPVAFDKQAQHFAKRGLVVFCPEYRLRRTDSTTIYECTEDAQSAVAWVRNHAKAYGIDKNKIVVGGGSAGGHLASSTAFFPSLNKGIAAKDYKPNALILFNPVLDISPEGYGHRAVKNELVSYKKEWVEFSPVQNVKKDFPPTRVVLGDRDKVISVKTAKKFTDTIVNNAKTIVYEGAEHSFFNLGYGKKQGYPKGTVNKFYFETLQVMDDFLTELGYLSKPFKIEIPAKAIYPIRKNN